MPVQIFAQVFYWRKNKSKILLKIQIDRIVFLIVKNKNAQV